MRHCRMMGILGLILLGILVCCHGAAADESGRSQPVQIEKTFDQGTLITHTLKLVQPPPHRFASCKSTSGSRGFR